MAVWLPVFSMSMVNTLARARLDLGDAVGQAEREAVRRLVGDGLRQGIKRGAQIDHGRIRSGWTWWRAPSAALAAVRAGAKGARNGSCDQRLTMLAMAACASLR